MISGQRFTLTLAFLAFFVFLFACAAEPARAGGTPPVRISVVPGGQSGIEQEACDRISQALSSSADVVISTVNPDWIAVCTITDKMDQMSGQIRYNGTTTVKTKDGHVINTVSVQKYNQDFSLTPGTPLNKRLVDNAARDVIQALTDRSVNPIQEAVQIEMETRKRIIQAELLAQDDKYEEGLSILRAIGPESPRFKTVRDLMDEYEIELEAIDLVKTAQSRAQQKRYTDAVKALKMVDPKSKRYRLAQNLIAKYRAGAGSPSKLVRNKPPQGNSAKPASSADAAALRALAAQKRALEAQTKAVEAQEQALRSKIGK